MIEKRKLERFNIYLDVIEQSTDNFIGITGNIHHEGMLLISLLEFALFKDIPILLETSGAEGIECKIPLVINGIWNQKKINPVHTRCRIVEPSPEAIHEIDKLIEEGAS